MPDVSKKRAAELTKVIAENVSHYPMIALVYSINDEEVDVIEARIGSGMPDAAFPASVQPMRTYKVREDVNGRAYFGTLRHQFYLDETVRTIS